MYLYRYCFYQILKIKLCRQVFRFLMINQYYIILMVSFKKKSDEIKSSFIEQNSLHPVIIDTKNNNKIKAIGYILLCNFCVVTLQCFVKVEGKMISPFYIFSARAFIQFIASYGFIRRKGESLSIFKQQNFGLAFKRAIFSTFAMALFMSSNRFIPIGIAITLFNTGPLMSVFIDAVFLKRSKISWVHFMITVFSFIGIIFIVQPEFLFTSVHKVTYFDYLIYALVLFSAFCFAMNLLYAYKIGNKISSEVTLCTTFLFHSIGTAIAYLCTYGFFQENYHYSEKKHSLDSILWGFVYFAIIVGVGTAGQFGEIKSMSLGKPSVMMPFSYLSVIGGMIVDSIIFDSQYNGWMIFGAILTSLGLFSKLIIQKFEQE